MTTQPETNSPREHKSIEECEKSLERIGYTKADITEIRASIETLVEEPIIKYIEHIYGENDK